MKSGSYTANLLGNIRSHLAGLQGYDVMALELIQNADDAKADEISFRISDEGLYVSNNGRFSYCGDLHSRPCKYKDVKGKSCDYHGIVDVGSGEKLSQEENIGRFGIGFVSAYQITDHPEIRSADIRLVLHPESGSWDIEDIDRSVGSEFFFPWASDPQSETRRQLNISHIDRSHIDQLCIDLEKVLRTGLLFLRHIKKAKLYKDERMLLSCEVDRGAASDVLITFHPENDIEYWHIIRADAAAASTSLRDRFPRLSSLKRDTRVSIAIKTEPTPLDQGLIFAFLPTEQLCGIPIHINADFFPESDRKAVIFSGNQHEQAWNEMLVDAAAKALAEDPESLFSKLGHKQFWQIVSASAELSKSSRQPKCFGRFWEHFKSTVPQSRVVLSHDHSALRTKDVLLPTNPLSEAELGAISALGGQTVLEDLRPFRNALGQLGALQLTLERLVTLISTFTNEITPGDSTVRRSEVNDLYVPIWRLVEGLLPEAEPSKSPVVKELTSLPFIATEDLFLVTIDQSYQVASPIKPEIAARLLPKLAIVCKSMVDYPKICRLIPTLSLRDLISHIGELVATDTIDTIISTEPTDLTEFYSLLVDLDRQGKSDDQQYRQLRSLPVWPSKRGLIKADSALLPGNFTDPTGFVDLLDVGLLQASAQEFVQKKLGINSQTIEEFIRSALPRFFTTAGPLDAQKYPRLLTELAGQPQLLNDEDIRRHLAGLSLLPSRAGTWHIPSEICRRTDDLVKVLGDRDDLWLDEAKVPNSKPVLYFLDQLGVRKSPSPKHLVERLISIAEGTPPSEDARRASADAFYALCGQYDESKDRREYRDALDALRLIECLPAMNDNSAWHTPGELYAPYQAEAFESQASILDFRNTQRLNSELLDELDITLNPETKLVVEHLLHCSNKGVRPHVSTYRVLTDRARSGDPQLSRLAGTPCISIDKTGVFVAPSRLFFVAPNLGKYAYKVPPDFEVYKPLFEAIGVKDFPDAEVYAGVLLEIVADSFERAAVLKDEDLAVYKTCLFRLGEIDASEELPDALCDRLRHSPFVLNVLNRPNHPDEVLLKDSEWYAGFFGGELDRALCNPTHECRSLLERCGVRRLSECTEVALEYVEGDRKPELEFEELLIDRLDMVGRLLYDRPRPVRDKVLSSLRRVRSCSHDLIRIQAKATLSDTEILAPPAPTQAFYKKDICEILLVRPVTRRSWSHALNAILYQLMPEESGSEIAKLTLVIAPLLVMPKEDADQALTDAGIPEINATEPQQNIDTTSPDLSGIEAEEEDTEGATRERSEEKKTDTARAGSQKNGADVTDENHEPHNGGRPGGMDDNTVAAPGGKKEDGSAAAREEASQRVAQPYAGGSAPEATVKKKRSEHKKQWDRRLLSYVKRHVEAEPGDGASDGSHEHNLAVEVLARAAVVSHETERGREVEQMPQTHPGYDLVSRDSKSGDIRYIEVKSISGEWNQTGVGLSRLQFSNAQDFGDSYWLYVVEFATDESSRRIHPIQNPSRQVTSFMFDGNWREAAVAEAMDPTLRFVVGTRLDVEHFGRGIITAIDAKGVTRLLLIKFESGRTQQLALNLKSMRVIDAERADDHT